MFWSRSRDEVWRKGDTSGDRQFIRSAHVDCDGDTLLFLVEQEGAGACHTGSYTCFFRAFGSDEETTRAARSDLSMADPRSRDVHGSWRAPTVWCRCGTPCWPTSRRRWPRSRACAGTTTRVGAGSCSSRSTTVVGGAGGRSSDATRKVKLVARAARSRSAAPFPPTCRPTRGCSPPSTRCSSTTGRRVAERPRLRGQRSRHCTPA